VAVADDEADEVGRGRRLEPVEVDGRADVVAEGEGGFESEVKTSSFERGEEVLAAELRFSRDRLFG
jgi:hypothetical protein